MAVPVEKGKVVLENDNYWVEIGVPPVSRNNPFPYPAYLIYNKNTGVLETYHSVLPEVRFWIDRYDEIIKQLDKAEDEEKERQFELPVGS